MKFMKKLTSMEARVKCFLLFLKKKNFLIFQKVLMARISFHLPGRHPR